MEGQLTSPADDTQSPALQGHVAPFRMLVDAVQDYAIYMLSPGGRVASWNAGAEKIIGYANGDVLGRTHTMFYPPDAIAAGWPQRELERAHKEGRFEDEGWRMRKDGRLFWASIVITAIHDRDGTLIGFSGILRDLTERRRQDEALRESEERFRLLVDGVSDYAIFMLDPEGRVMSWNPGAARIKGYMATEIIGQHFSRFYAPAAIEAGLPQRALQEARTKGRYETEDWRVRKDGSRFWAHVILTPLRDRDGRPRGFAKVTRDLTERKRIEALEYEDRNMSEFLAMFGHELRNPLAPIRTAVGVMRMEGANEEARRTSLEVLDRQSQLLTRLVDELLDVSRIHSGSFSLRRQATPLSMVVGQALEAAKPQLDALRHKVTVRLGDEELVVDGDRARLAQLVAALLDNAAKYTPEGGRIELELSRRRGDALITVRDTGVGIRRELLPRVFDLFVQGDRELARTEGGLGVGLTLVRRIAELHGGSVLAYSDGPGRGSFFSVRLPLAQRPAEVAGDDDPARAPSRPLKVIVVDDNRDSASSMAMLLQLWGHHAVATYDGPTALALAREMHPDLMLLDLGLPGMTGYDVAGAVRDTEGLEDVLLAAMTGYGQDADIEQGAQAGFDEHLVKPVDEDALRQVLVRAADGDAVDPTPTGQTGNRRRRVHDLARR